MKYAVYAIVGIFAAIGVKVFVESVLEGLEVGPDYELLQEYYDRDPYLDSDPTLVHWVP